jgi:hypothetical protein
LLVGTPTLGFFGVTGTAIFLVLSLFVLIALFVKNKTPKQALFSVARETLKGLRCLRLPLPSLEESLRRRLSGRVRFSPYKKTRNETSHAPLLLNLPTSEGSGEATHPDVLYIPGSWCGWTWLMSATPYPSSEDFFENPELYVSRDAFCWTPPAEGVNPLSRVPLTARRDLKKEFHSDASLLLRGETLHVYYRWTGIFFDGSAENRICLKTSTDGRNWSGSVTLIEEKCLASEARGFLSPSVLFMNGEYVMWVVEYEDGKRSIVRRTSADGLNWSKPKKTPIAYPQAHCQAPWHLDVIPDLSHDDLILVLTTAKDRGFDAELFYGFSSDWGRSWQVVEKLVEPGYFFERKRVYRSSIAIRDDEYFLFYSAMSEDETWSVARIKLKRTGLRLATPPLHDG